MNTRRKQSNDNNDKNKVTTCQLELQGNEKIFSSSLNQSTGSNSDFPAMNTRSKSVKRNNFHTQQSQHPKKKIKISNVNKMPGKKSDFLDLEEADMQIVPINKLNDYCLEEVFMYLSPEERLKNELVCKKWRSINRLLLKRVQKLDFYYVEPDWDFIVETTGALFIWEETLFEFKQRFNYVPRLLQLTGKYLRELDLSALTNTVILTKLKQISFPHLVKLKLRLYIWNYHVDNHRTNVVLDYNGYKPKHCDNLFDKMPKLESLHLTKDCRQRLPENFITAMLPLANTLKELSVINNTYHTYYKERYMSDAFSSGESRSHYLRELTGFKSLRFLELKGFYLRKKDCEALRRFSNLKKLVLPRCFSAKANNLLPLCAIENLQELVLCQCDEEIDDFLTEVPNNLKNLTKLILYKPYATADAIDVISSVKRFQTIEVYSRKKLKKIIYT